MSLSADKVVAASNAWTWIPDNAMTEATQEYLLVRFPDYFDHPLELLQVHPRGAVGGRPWRPPWKRCSSGRASSASPTSTGGSSSTARPRSRTCSRRAARRSTRRWTCSRSTCARARPRSCPRAARWTLRWATEVATHRDGTQVGVTVFGGSMPPEERLAEEAKRDRATVKAGDGGMVVAYIDGAAVGSGGLAMADGVARLWGGAVLETARGQGVYRAMLAARLKYGVGPRRDDGPRQGPHRYLRPDPPPGRLRRLRPGSLLPRPAHLSPETKSTPSHRTDRAPGPTAPATRFPGNPGPVADATDTNRRGRWRSRPQPRPVGYAIDLSRPVRQLLS